RPRLLLRRDRRQGGGTPRADEHVAARARRAVRHDPVVDRAARARRPPATDRHPAAHRRSPRLRSACRARTAPVIVAVVGDSISAGSPLWDPDPAVRAGIAHPDERSQWQWWANANEPRFEFRTRAAYGKR